MTYAWKRFWSPRDHASSLDGDGYLYDPEDDYGTKVNAHVKPLPSFLDSRCIVLLGEPGIGKSTEFCSAADQVADLVAQSGDVCWKIDLKEYQTDTSLKRDVFEHQQMLTWREGSHVLHLFFDSLDEGRLEVRNIASILSGQLKRLEPHLGRLRVRIACRTAEWLPSLEKTLTELWKKIEPLQVLMLMPLRHVDVRTATEANNLCYQTFYSEASRVSAHAFATNPIGLNFLIDIYRQSGKLPSTKYQLYEDGCRYLCEEISQSRRDAGHVGKLTASQRVAVASRVAAMMVFSGRTVVDISISPTIEDDSVTVSKLAGGSELIERDQFSVSEAAVRDTLSTAIFSGNGTERVVFFHKTYAEFLAARYLICRNLDLEQVGSLLFHRECDTRVVPQLAETAAWVAVKDDTVFERLMDGDPETLLRSDVAIAYDESRKRLVDKLLQGYRSKTLDVWNWSARDHYHKLRHAGIAEQLSTVLEDKTELVETRQFVATLVEKCSISEMSDICTNIALDNADFHQVRVQAARAVVSIGEPNNLHRLKPLTSGSGEDDPNDDLRGIALRELWDRRVLSAQDLFNSLIEPQENSYLGLYRHFLLYELPTRLQPVDLEMGLRWYTRLLRQGIPNRNFNDIRQSIVSLSVDHLAQPATLEAFAEYVTECQRRYEPLGVDREQLDSIPDEQRRLLITAIVRQVDDVEAFRFLLIDWNPGIVRGCDLDWLLTLSITSSAQADQTRWAKLARLLILSEAGEGIDSVIQYKESSGVISVVFADLIRPIALDSAQANEMRARHAQSQALHERLTRREEITLLDPPPSVRVEACLNRCEQGNPSSWRQVTWELQLETDSTHYLRELEDDVRLLPGWVNADGETHLRLISAAQLYLHSLKNGPSGMFCLRRSKTSGHAGYKALVLLHETEPEYLESLTSDIWASLVLEIIDFPNNSGTGNDSEIRQQELLKRAYDAAPDTVIRILLNLIDQDDREKDYDRLFVLHRIEHCRDKQMAQALLQKARDRALKPGSRVQLIEFAHDVSPEASEAMAKSLLANSLAIGELRRSIAASCTNCRHIRYNRNTRSAGEIRSRKPRRHKPSTRNNINRRKRARESVRLLAVFIWRNCSDRWNILWPRFERDCRLFKDVMTSVAHEGRRSKERLRSLTESQLGQLYISLSQHFPHSDDVMVDGAHWVSERESVQNFREEILSLLRDQGTAAAIKAIMTVRDSLPHLAYIDRTLRAAHKLMLETSWRPAPFSQLKAMFNDQRSRLVRSERELHNVVIESLARLQQRLHGETPSVRDVWDLCHTSSEWRPVDENAFSDYLARHLKEDLKGCGIVALREVEIRRGDGDAGECTDLYVTATTQGDGPDEWNTVRVIVEVKGCWHKEVKTAMVTQLKGRYLLNNECRCGIYAIGWFKCDAWDKGDYRRKQTPGMSFDEAQAYFNEQSSRASDANTLISAVVLDASLK